MPSREQIEFGSMICEATAVSIFFESWSNTTYLKEKMLCTTDENEYVS